MDVTRCPHCESDVPRDDLFCESCGLRLFPSSRGSVRCACGPDELEVDAEGYCQSCGLRVQRPASDHVELVASSGLVAVSDRGRVHRENEDRAAVVHEAYGAALVLCDGVSSTQGAATAAETVTSIVAEELRTFLRSQSEGTAADVLRAAIRRATLTLSETQQAGGSEAEASTTVVAAVVAGRGLTVAWAGDSRAYWIADAESSCCLTTDHSWLNARTREGLPVEAAEAQGKAHAIVRWIGGDVNPDDPESGPEVVSRSLQSPGTLLLCSDGLWNYAASEAELCTVLRQAGLFAGAPALAVADHIVTFANAQGGQDNITVALLRWSPETPALHESSEPATDFVRTRDEEGNNAAAVSS